VKIRRAVPIGTVDRPVTIVVLPVVAILAVTAPARLDRPTIAVAAVDRVVAVVVGAVAAVLGGGNAVDAGGMETAVEVEAVRPAIAVVVERVGAVFALAATLLGEPAVRVEAVDDAVAVVVDAIRADLVDAVRIGAAVDVAAVFATVAVVVDVVEAADLSERAALRTAG